MPCHTTPCSARRREFQLPLLSEPFPYMSSATPRDPAKCIDSTDKATYRPVAAYGAQPRQDRADPRQPVRAHLQWCAHDAINLSLSRTKYITSHVKRKRQQAQACRFLLLSHHFSCFVFTYPRVGREERSGTLRNRGEARDPVAGVAHELHHW